MTVKRDYWLGAAKVLALGAGLGTCLGALNAPAEATWWDVAAVVAAIAAWNLVEWQGRQP